MRARSSSYYYPSTKFSVLTDRASIESARRNCLAWILIVTLLFCLTVATLSYKIFIAPVYFNEQITRSNNNGTSVAVKDPKSSLLKSYNPVPLLARFGKRNKGKSEFSCGEAKHQEAVPSVYTEKMFQNYFENLYDYINFDLLLHYDYIINKYPPKTLKSIFNEYQFKLLSIKNSENFEDFLTVLKSNKFKFYSRQLKNLKYDLKLENFENYIALTDELSHWYNFLDCLPGLLSSYEEVKVRKYFRGWEEENFEIFTEETQQKLHHLVYSFKVSEKKLTELNESINEWMQPLKTEFHNCSAIFYNKAIALSDVNDKIRDLNASCLENVYVFASSRIYLDEDLKLLGINVAIIAPEWVFLKKIRINLNGLAGRNHTNGTSDPFQPGEPGNPGGNAGDFLGIGNFIEKFLLISANGGKGGSGQNGAKGRDGVNNSWPGPPVSKPACVTKIRTFNNTYGEMITHYEIYNEAGCGGSGADGGAGGIGGAGGVITLININGIKITKGLNGKGGTPGKGGVGGVGGHNGCFYEVLDVDDEILHPVTRVKCRIGNILPSGTFGKDSQNFLGQIFPPAKENLASPKCLSQFFRFAGDDFIKHNDANALSFLRDLNQLGLYNELNLADIVNEYKMIKTFDRTEIYSIFSEKIKSVQHLSNLQPAVKYLKSIVLGKMLILKKNIDFLFIDLKNYLKFLRKNIINTNMRNPEMQTLLHFKKIVGIKCEQVKLNLERIRMKLTGNLSGESYGGSACNNQTKSLSKKTVVKKRILEIMVSTIDLYFLINRHSNDKKFIKRNTLSSCYVENKSKIESSIADAENILFKIVKNLENEKELKEYLEKLGGALSRLKESGVLSDPEKNLLRALTNELEHFIALFYFMGWERLEKIFSESLSEITLNKSSHFEESHGLKFLKKELVDVVIAVQYKVAVNAARQSLYPFVNDSLQLLQRETTVNNVLTQIDILQDTASQSVNPYCKNHLKAVFKKDSAVGEFYFWPNSEIKNKLKYLFLGAEISLKADLINPHAFDKNFIQFTSLKLEFECTENRSKCERHLNEILSNFKIEMTHSGYSYYNWKGDTQIVVSEKVSLNYSFRMRDNGVPEVYNSLFEKCQSGEIKLSPFTTWTVRLLPLNDAADFTSLPAFADSVNLRLTGTGTYIS